ncbi:RING-6 [Tricharina praecox]|uniref:RING-6 n=1 Tax=Tricharina praecox TaxID=43433 RepID=UPI002220BF78|nr:RING-6 [Tricharina praecox]KAI5844838.1 RING-6 [Tricharina praecox]
MTKKKKRQNPEIDELLARPWCYYCERDFDDLKILIHHQKAKHFKCERCARRLNTAGGLRVHMEQVHKETLEQVENALPGRESIDLEIFGTEGIPESEVAAHNQRIMADYAQKEADRRAASGQSNGPKKPKIDISKELDPEEIKRKLEAHKKAMASGGATPVTPVGASMSPGRSQSPGGFDAHASPQVAPPQIAYPQVTSPPFQQGQFGMPQPNAFQPPPNAFQQPPNAFQPPQANAFQPQPYGQQPPPNAYSAPPYAQPYQQQPQQPPAPFGRGGPQPPYNGYQQPSAAYGAPPFNNPPHNQFQQGPPPHMQQRHQPPPSLPLPHQIPGLPPKPNVAGLPPRPAFTNPAGGFGRGHASGPPPGQWSPPVPQQQQHHDFSQQGAPPYAQSQPQQFSAGYSHSHQQPPHQPYGGFSSRPGPANATPLGPQHVLPPRTEVQPVSDAASGIPIQPTPETPAEKKEDVPVVKPKRETKLVYGDNDVSPEEKRASLARYQVAPSASATVTTSA